MSLQRREFITLLSAAAAWPLAIHAQQRGMPVIGFLRTGLRPPPSSDDIHDAFDRGLREPGYVEGRTVADDIHDAFDQGLREFGYVESRNVAIEYRYAENRFDRLPSLAAELVRRNVNAIVPNGLGIRAAKAATSSIPIVFYTGQDPVRAGFVASLSRPGGNLTGVTVLSDEVNQKRLELLHELIPTATSIALLINPTNRARAAIQQRDLESAARSLALAVHVLHASSEDEFERAFSALNQLQAGGLVIAGDPLFTSRSEKLAELATLHRIPAIYQYRRFAAAGGLMSYGGSLSDAWRLLGAYTGRVLKGEKPGDLPVQQSTKVELVLNLKTAKAFGLTVPLSLRGRADEIIE